METHEGRCLLNPPVIDVTVRAAHDPPETNVMRFEKTSLNGAWLIEPEPVGDVRGSFARTFCKREYAAHLAFQHVIDPMEGKKLAPKRKPH